MSDRLFQVLLGVLLLILTGMAGVAADRASDANTSLAQLTSTVHLLTTQVTVLNNKVNNLPPRELLLKIDNAEEAFDQLSLEQKRLQVQIDVLEQWIRDNHTNSRKPRPRPYVPGE